MRSDCVCVQLGTGCAACRLRESGLQPDAVFMLPANHISNSAVNNYALPPEAAGPPGVSAYAPDAAGPRYDHVDFDALYSVGRAAFGPVSLLCCRPRERSRTECEVWLLTGCDDWRGSGHILHRAQPTLHLRNAHRGAGLRECWMLSLLSMSFVIQL